MPALRQVLVADDEPSIRHVLTLVLTDSGYEVRAVSDGEEALRELAAHSYDVVISDVRMPKLDGLQLLEKALTQQPELTFLVMSAYGSKDLALSAVSKGAWDFIEKPFKPEEIVFLLRKAEERSRLMRENRRLKLEDRPTGPLDRLSGTSEPMQQLKRNITRLAPVSTTVLISGESGTGKELVARALHELSLRAAQPFVAVNCGAIPAGLIESELFGHARGAFTDARTAKRGLFSEADGGTIFLDEVGELPMQAQVKLLRVLQEGEVRPVGESKVEKVDVRVIGATLRDLGKLVEKGEFREDLFFRLNVVPLKVPALRDRKDDVLLLGREFLNRFNRDLNRDPPLTGFSPEAESLLTAYAWPGNVRELENAVERAVLLSESTLVDLASLPEKLWTARPVAAATAVPLPTPDSMQFSLKRAITTVEEQFIKAALRQTRGNRTRAAELLEISHRALLYKIKDYGIDPDAEGEKGPR
ncbi:MAG: sigma-54-dependent Fis family transcriptional regulator [Archangium sp.]|nr:sigma-54-dependent Fis family transcriptional regulator [Archangium sp.]